MRAIFTLFVGAHVARAATTAIAKHLVKWVVYQRVVVPGGAICSLATGMRAGTWAGMRLMELLPVARFRLPVAGLWARTAVQTLWMG
ncbi:hypothetical protein CA233_02520 [Sphingomonas sp. ABOLD]|uniref:Uncharacterized protein n=1 Tax=Sphingomonas trueperi TaxID=53317 RepID=A0A7X5XWS2_9SPHN|nr:MULTISPECIES: hypothetical protein [Sphingomonas]NJB96802.1 hypothetical protein [Sphingomonas trueperi]RSV44371.1 hypothetical protein CA234_02845 [Sphingomonas sp. ABOLE]RSV51920.1 hypothetical protein CA233_02520 [Sphingomonas sp. ABOLD]